MRRVLTHHILVWLRPPPCDTVAATCTCVPSRDTTGGRPVELSGCIMYMYSNEIIDFLYFCIKFSQRLYKSKSIGGYCDVHMHTNLLGHNN